MAIKFYDSLDVGVMVHKPDTSTYNVFVPRGCFDRHFLLTYLLMNATGIRGVGKIAKSPADIELFTPYIPIRLRPIFDPDPDTYVENVSSLLKSHVTNYFVPSFIRDACFSAAVFLAYHESVHIQELHFEIKALLEARSDPLNHFDASVGMSRREIFEGFEVQADQLAAEYLASALQGAIQAAKEMNQDSQATIFNWASGIAILITLLDAKSRSFVAPSETYYPHPLVRWKLITGTICESLPESLQAQFLSLSDRAREFVKIFVDAIYLHEICRDDPHGSMAAVQSCALGNLYIDENLFGRSLLFEQVIVAAERGRRISFLAEQMGFMVSIKDQFKLSELEQQLLWVRKGRQKRANIV